MLALLPFLASALLGADTLLVSPAWLSAHLHDPLVVVVHVDRSRSGYDAGHIEGSRYLPLAALLADRDGVPNEMPPVATLDSVLESVGIGDDSRVIITGDPLAAARLFVVLDYLGHGDGAALLDGSTEGWIQAGFPAANAPAPATRGSLTPRVDSAVVVDAAWVAGHLGRAGTVFLDARPATDFIGTPGSSPPTGHIPGARNIYWKTTLGGVPPAVLSRPELAAMFHGAGIRAGDMVVAYCRSGMQAGFLYFVARYLGYETRLYDGSMADWLRRPEAPIETGVGE